MRFVLQNSVAAATLGILVMSCAPVQAMAALPPVQMSGHVEYMTGGVGADESAAIESAGKRWPLTIEFAVKDKKHADFAADVKTTIRNAKGQPVLDVNSSGPILLAKLGPGRYTVDATLEGKTLREKVLVKHGRSAKAVFLWPAGATAGHA